MQDRKDGVRDFLDSLDLIGLSKFFSTLKMLLVNPAYLLQQLSESEGKYIKPFKFAAMAVAPVLLLTGFFGMDVKEHVMEAISLPAINDDPRPNHFNRITSSVLKDVLSVYFGNFYTLFNMLLIAPIMAWMIYLWNKRGSGKSFYYCYQLALYISALIAIKDLASLFLSSLSMIRNPIKVVSFATEVFLFIYICYRTFEQKDKFIRVAKPIFTFVSFNAILFVIFFLIAFPMLLIRMQSNPWHPHTEMGVATKEIGKPPGIKLIYVVPQSPASEAGFLENDLLLKINNRVVTNESTLRIALTKIDVSNEATAVVIRNEKQLNVRFKLKPFDKIFGRRNVYYGYAVEYKEEGNFVTDVDVGSPVDKAGLLIHDNIVMEDSDSLVSTDIAISSLRDLRRKPGDTVVLTIIRHKKIIRLPVCLAAQPAPEVLPFSNLH